MWDESELVEAASHRRHVSEAQLGKKRGLYKNALSPAERQEPRLAKYRRYQEKQKQQVVV